MAESKATIPHFTLSMDVDMEGAVELREQLKALAEQQGTPVPSYNDMVVKACAIALRDFPLVNASYKDGSFELHSRVNIGVAVAGEGTLIVPTIFDADRKGLGQIATESRALAEKVREGKISPPELSGATFSITNLGMYGVTTFTAVINPPQSAILAVGKMEPKPVVRDGEVTVRNGMNVDDRLRPPHPERGAGGGVPRPREGDPRAADRARAVTAAGAAPPAAAGAGTGAGIAATAAPAACVAAGPRRGRRLTGRATRRALAGGDRRAGGGGRSARARGR